MKKIPCDPQAGSDIEVFLVNEKNTVIPCVGLVKGTKEKPHRPKGMPKGYAVQEDNVMLEFNVPPVRSDGRKTVNRFYVSLQ